MKKLGDCIPLQFTRLYFVVRCKKEKKLYLCDWSTVEETSPRFENMVAGHLLKYCHFLEDTQGERMELRFLRDIEKREIDFCEDVGWFEVRGPLISSSVLQRTCLE